jgi:hypothetical protein
MHTLLDFQRMVVGQSMRDKSECTVIKCPFDESQLSFTPSFNLDTYGDSNITFGLPNRY